MIDSLRRVLIYAVEFLDIIPDSAKADPDIAAIAQMIAAYDALAPDWSQAPEWSKWSAIHANELRYWFECEPSWQYGDTGWDRNGGKQEFDCEMDLPIGIDWRLLKWQRPEVVQNG